MGVKVSNYFVPKRVQSNNRLAVRASAPSVVSFQFSITMRNDHSVDGRWYSCPCSALRVSDRANPAFVVYQRPPECLYCASSAFRQPPEDGAPTLTKWQSAESLNNRALHLY